MNKQQVEQSLPFKAAKKILKKVYPWIKDIRVPDDVERYNSLIFLKIIIDAEKLVNSFPNYDLDDFYKKYFLKDPSDIWGSSHVGLFLQPKTGKAPAQQRIEDTKYVTDDILKILDGVSRSSAYPHELRLEGNRKFDISNFYLDPYTINVSPSQP